MSGRVVVIDVNFLSWLHRIDANCDLVDFICEAFGGYAVGDGPQLAVVNYCEDVAARICHHDTTDAEAVDMMNTRNDVDFARTIGDPVDARLLTYTLREDGVLLTCDTGMLMVAHQLGVEHWCFKAAIWETDEAWEGAISESSDYATEAMEDEGRNPYFNRNCCTHCHKCDPWRQCRHGHVY